MNRQQQDNCHMQPEQICIEDDDNNDDDKCNDRISKMVALCKKGDDWRSACVLKECVRHAHSC